MNRVWMVLLGWMALTPLVLANTEAPYRHKVYSLQVERQESYQALRRFSGRALAAQRADLAFEVSGQIASIPVEEGQRVEQGQVLMVLDTGLLEAELQQLQAQRMEIQARLGNIHQELKRQGRLQRQGYASQQRTDDLEAENQALQAQLRRNAAQQRSVNIRLEKSVLLAPFPGEVGQLSAERGVIAQPGKPLLRLVEIANNEAVIGIPESLKKAVNPGNKVAVSGDFGQVIATVLSVSSTVNPGTLTHSVRLLLPADLVVADSSIVYMALSEEREQTGFWLPMDSLLQGFRGTWAVYALAEGGAGRYQLEKRSVVPIHQQDDRVFVRAELQDGELVVAGGVHRLAPGQEVVLK